MKNRYLGRIFKEALFVRVAVDDEPEAYKTHKL